MEDTGRRRSSLEYGTKLDEPKQGSWVFRLYPDAAEGGGSFRSAGDPASPSPYPQPLTDYRDDAARRARGKVRRYCAANGLNRLGTLTYAGQGNHDPAKLRRDVRAFFRRLGGASTERFPYLWVPEWHPGGHGLHVHFAVGRYVPQRAIEAAWGHGFVHIKLLGNLPVGSGVRGEARLAARYLSKYVGKDLGTGEAVGLHRYEVAQGFQPASVPIKADTADEALGWAAVVMSAAPVHVWRSREQDGWVGPSAVWASWA
jgi:hypothetical protein